MPDPLRSGRLLKQRIAAPPAKTLDRVGWLEAESSGVKSVGWRSGTKDLLDHIHDLGSDCGFRSAAMVGAGSNHPNLLPEMVGGLPQRLVLADAATLFAFIRV